MNYLSKLKPYEHQQRALERLKGHKAFALLMAMRTGKTKVVLDDFGELELAGLVNALLVIAPGGVYRTWETAVKDHVSDDLSKRLLVHVWNGGKSKTEQAALRHLLGFRGPKALFINIEALSTVKAAKEFCIEFLRTTLCYGVVDESTIIKGMKSKRTEFIIDFIAPLLRYRRILSGLPTPQSPMDLYTQFEFLDPKILGFRSFYSFRGRFAVMKKMVFGGRKVNVIVGYRDIEELQARIAPYSYRCRLEDTYDMPPKIYMRRDVALTEEQKRIYAEIRLYANAQIEAMSYVTATAVITQIIKLHQVLCGHVTDDDGIIKIIPELRTRELLDLLEDYDGKAIIWCSYDYDVKHVSEVLKKAYGENSVARFWGGNRNTREAEEKNFLSLSECRWMVSTSSAGGRGRTWTVADLLVYYSSTSDLEHRSQSEERAQAVNRPTSVACVDLIAPGTVEEKIIKNLRGKINIASVINGDNYREWLI